MKSLPELKEDLERDVVSLLFAQAFYGHVLIGIEKTVDPRLPATASMHVSSHALLKVHPDKFFSLDDVFRLGILEHEILHVILKHVLRMMRFPIHKKANVAADLVVNCLIGKEKLPPWALFPDLYELPNDLTLEDYYDLIPEVESRPSGDDAGGGGGGADDFNPYIPQGYSLLDLHDWESSAGENQDLAELVIDDMIRNAERRCGHLPGNIKDLIHYKEEHVVPWESVVRRFLGTGRASLSWTKKRISRRYDTRPGTRLDDSATILFGVDASGSTTSEQGAFMTELLAAHRTGLVDIWATIGDTQITDVIHPIRKIGMIKGGGGTNLQIHIDYALDRSQHPCEFDGIIILTDGVGPVQQTRPRIPVLWVLTHAGVAPCDWGTVLRLPEGFEKEKGF